VEVSRIAVGLGMVGSARCEQGCFERHAESRWASERRPPLPEWGILALYSLGTDECRCQALQKQRHYVEVVRAVPAGPNHGR
jgi:hypothetical protein